MKNSRIIISIGVALFGSSQVAPAGVLLQDNFNTENGGVSAYNYTGFANFNVTQGGVHLVGNGFFDYGFPGQGLYLVLTNPDLPAILESKTLFSFSAGDSLKLQFALAGCNCDLNVDQTSTVNVSLGSLYTQSFTLSPGAQFGSVNESISVPSATTARLVFANTGDNGLLLDDISLISTPAPAGPAPAGMPEPSTFLLTLGILPLLIRRAMKPAGRVPSSRAAAPRLEARE